MGARYAETIVAWLPVTAIRSCLVHRVHTHQQCTAA